MNKSITVNSRLQIAVILLLIISCSRIYPLTQLKTQINVVKVGNAEIPYEKWNDIIILPHDSITLSYSVEDALNLKDQILYKVFLNGKVVEPKLNMPQDEFITLENLQEGVYIVKVQAYFQQGPDIIPAIMKFSVTSKKHLSNNDSEASSNLNYYYGIIKYALIFFGILLVVVIVIYLKKRSNVPSGSSEIEKRDALSVQTEVQMKKESGQSVQDNDLLKSYNILNSEFEDLTYTYERLKKEFYSIKETNAFLKQQVNLLKSDIADLETANVQLNLQKEKLLDNKRQLEELQIQKDELFAIAIHDIKNPAAAIRGYVELLESYDLNAQEQQEVMQSLVDTSSHIIDMAQKMSLVVSKTKPEPMLVLEKASIKAIADTICNRNAGYALKKNIKLINQTSPHTPETQLDISKIEEVFDNLINNAIKYAPKGTVVQVKSYFSGSKITVEVSDNGVGLSEEDCKKAFTKGALLTPQPTDGEVRSGLGLWIVKKIIEEHEGKVWVKSKLGVGSTFLFELPINK